MRRRSKSTRLKCRSAKTLCTLGNIFLWGRSNPSSLFNHRLFFTYYLSVCFSHLQLFSFSTFQLFNFSTFQLFNFSRVIFSSLGAANAYPNICNETPPDSSKLVLNSDIRGKKKTCFMLQIFHANCLIYYSKLSISAAWTHDIDVYLLNLHDSQLG